MNQIPSSSPSRLTVYEQCPLRAWLQFGKKIPDPTPKPAADRGTAMHKMAEDFVRGKQTGSFPYELGKFKEEFHVLRTLFLNGQASLEGEWGYDQEWTATEWKSAWLRLKLDAIVHVSETEAIVIDYKSGKRFGNEIKHGEQLMFYAAATASRFPLIQSIHTELWYLDIDEVAYAHYTREAAMRALARFHTRLEKMTKPQIYQPNPNIFSCKYCPYGSWGTGHCKAGKK